MNGSKNISNIMIIIAICSIGGIIFGGMRLLPKFQELQSNNKTLESKRNELKYKEDYYKELQKVQEEIKGYEEELAKIDVALPNEPSVPSLFDFLQTKTSQSGLVINSMGNFSVAASSKHPGLKEVSLNLDVSGPYQSLKNFLPILENSSRLIDVESISFGSPVSSQVSVSQLSGTFVFNLALKVYSY